MTPEQARETPAMTPVDAILARLLSLHPKKIDLSLDRITRLLDRLGHPERRLPPVIHVAGTNGKGSTIAFMRAILETAGHRVHVYTSPHLVRFNERYRVGRAGGSVLASDDELVEALAECERCNGHEPITVFEMITAAGFLLFSRHDADVLLLEVGLGGRLDATNVIDRPLASVITSVSFDHGSFLGNTVTKIAAEKAGILKKNVPGIVAPQTDEVAGVITRHAARVGAPMMMAGVHWAVAPEHGRLVYQDEGGLLDLPAPRLQGRHQFDNAGAAIAALRSATTLANPAAAFEAGLLTANWPARLQRVTHGRLLGLVSERGEMWIDGAHNADGGRVIAAALADLEERVARPVVLIVGMLASKDCDAFLRNFAGLARRVIAVPIGQENSLPPPAVAAAAQRVGIPAEVSTGIESALATLNRLDLHAAPRVLVTGSLYIAGEFLAANATPPI
jgi:dihydrofolate synthase / folylpolyglutamate synthase